ncbi:MAG TPA: family 1 glycosylhydrolase [Fimbriimonadaceae bacterium]|nr:family 1 glycosylhydrolase [Fimbriimonadaceae bacterium]
MEPDFFFWATGIEDTFIVDPHRGTGRILDEYALTQHYEHLEDDIELGASLGVAYMRYGIPWYRIEPSPDRFDFDLADRALGRLLDSGVQPIVDLIHYGTPHWLEGSFANPEYPERMAQFARRVAERFQGRIFWYTPLNEPRITAYYCGKLGWWPPYMRSWRGFIQVMLSVCRGIVLTQEALRSVDDRIVVAHVDATDSFTAIEESGREAAELRQAIVFLALDLITGRVDDDHPLTDWLIRHGVKPEALSWFRERAVDLDVLGLNLYPMFTDKFVARRGTRLRIRMRYSDGGLVERLAHAYWHRYRTPLFISETASIPRRRGEWMDQSIEAVRKARAEGIPVCGYTWWPLFALVGWAYRQGGGDLRRYLLEFGLWDLEAEDGNLIRKETPLAERYRDVVGRGSECVGSLRSEAGSPIRPTPQGGVGSSVEGLRSEP